MLIIIAFECCGQTSSTPSSRDNIAFDIVGVWQAEKYDEGSGWPDTYQFFSDRTFVFNFSQYDGSKRILRIKGTYKIEKGTLLLMIENTVEAVGGYLTRSTLTSLSDSWELTDYEIQTVKQNNPEPETVKLKTCEGSYPKECLLLDARKYFRMDKDPSKYN
ncbi:MAG TPA: hypothetical protein VEB86_08365 [Chryseosolibacter sp.]|nr:hypothetical protein [Chryseosolibacter sp.]